MDGSEGSYEPQLWLDLAEIDPALVTKAGRLINLLHQAREGDQPMYELDAAVLSEVVVIHLGGYRDAVKLQKPDSIPRPKRKQK